MKKVVIILCTVIIVLTNSCEINTYINFGFDSPVNKSSSGLVINDVPGTSDRLFLNGIIKLSEGEVEVILTNPAGINTYSTTVIAPAEFQIKKSFDAKDGYWKLKYLSKEGVGTIDLHLYAFSKE